MPMTPAQRRLHKRFLAARRGEINPWRADKELRRRPLGDVFEALRRLKARIAGPAPTTPDGGAP